MKLKLLLHEAWVSIPNNRRLVDWTGQKIFTILRPFERKDRTYSMRSKRINASMTNKMDSRKKIIPSCFSSVYLHFPFKSQILTTPSTVPVPNRLPLLFQSIVVTSLLSFPSQSDRREKWGEKQTQTGA
jgi:hypothetical protein